MDALEKLSERDNLVFEFDEFTFTVRETEDKSANVRLRAGKTLKSATIISKPTTLTRAIVLGQGQQEERQCEYYNTPQSLQAEQLQGYIIEKIFDRRDSDDTNEHAETAYEELEKAKGTISAGISPDEDILSRFDLRLGDIVAVEILGEHIKSTVCGIAIKNEYGTITSSISLKNEFEQSELPTNVLLSLHSKLTIQERSDK
jgi:hypothetical protein